MTRFIFLASWFNRPFILLNLATVFFVAAIHAIEASPASSDEYALNATNIKSCHTESPLRFIHITGGSFNMGDTNGEYSDEAPANRQTVHSFCMMENLLLADELTHLITDKEVDWLVTQTPLIPEPSEDEIEALLTNGNIQKVQAGLKQLGIYLGNIDGQIGRQTKHALTEFQRRKHLDPTGQMNYETAYALAENLTESGYHASRISQYLKPEEQLNNVSGKVAQLYWTEATILATILSRKFNVVIRLPTEAEWEYAARGGLIDKSSPWGNNDDTYDGVRVSTLIRYFTGDVFDEYGEVDKGWVFDESLFNRCSQSNEFGNALECLYDYKALITVPRNLYGLRGLMGIWQWASSSYAPYPYNSDDGRERREGDAPRVIRGGGTFLDTESADPRVALRGYGSNRSSYAVRFVYKKND